MGSYGFANGIDEKPAEEQYFIGSAIKKPAAHHESFKQLWETKWKKPCSMGVYPFMFGATKDFQPVVDELVKKDMKEPYDWDAYAETFVPFAQALSKRAEEAEKAGEKEKASELYLRSSALWRISRFPLMRSPKQKAAWEENKRVCLKGLSLRPHPVHEVLIPHTHAISGEGEHIPVYFQLPDSASASSPVPLIIIMTGLDGYRTDLAVWMEGWRQKGCGCLVVEIPGTGDSPAFPKDPTSPDRQWASMLDWVEKQEGVDAKKLVVWAFSTGGYYAIRLAHQFPDRLKGLAAVGGGAHHMFDHEWLDNVNHLEYPFDLAGALCTKFGYGDDMETFKKEASDKFSLLKDGTLQKPRCAPLLLVNGMLDEIFPVDDYILVMQHGAPKQARLMPGIKHMGEPESFIVIIKWIYDLLGIKENPITQMKTIPFQPKY